MGLRNKSTGEQHLQLYIDNFEVKAGLPLETLDATAIDHNSSTLNAWATSDYSMTFIQRGFYWSQTNSLPTANDNVQIVAGTSQEYSFELTGLSPETTYYFRAFLTNADGTLLGEVAQFTTLAALDIVELPFTDPIEDLTNWDAFSVAGDNQWHMCDDGIDGGNCARLYTNDSPEVNDDWLVSPIFNTEATTTLRTSFDYWYYGDNFTPEFYYSFNYEGNFEAADWNKINYSFSINEWGWKNIYFELEDIGETFTFAFRYQSNIGDNDKVLIDNFKTEVATTNTLESVFSVSNFKIYPNPITNESIISFNTNYNEKVTISIYDMNGRIICTFLDKNLAAGMHKIKLGNQMLTNGVYLCKLATPKGISTLKLIVGK